MSHYPTSYAYPTSTSGNVPQLSYFPPFPHTQLQTLTPPPPQRPPSPDPLAVTPAIASQTVQRLISSELRDAGFSAAQSGALQRLESEVVAFVEQIYQRAHEYANLANRSGAIITDLMLACDDCNLPTKELRATRAKINKKRRKSIHVIHAHSLTAPRSRSVSPERLPSDDEGAPPNIPITLRALPQHLPALPPKHTYLQTPASPPKRAALPSLEKKLKTASLVQDSLEHLLITTEDSSGQKDAELLGHIVNWETNVHPRKNWKLKR